MLIDEQPRRFNEWPFVIVHTALLALGLAALHIAYKHLDPEPISYFVGVGSLSFAILWTRFARGFVRGLTSRKRAYFISDRDRRRRA
jgi:hypothetical protein